MLAVTGTCVNSQVREIVFYYFGGLDRGLDIIYRQGKDVGLVRMGGAQQVETAGIAIKHLR